MGRNRKSNRGSANEESAALMQSALKVENYFKQLQLPDAPYGEKHDFITQQVIQKSREFLAQVSRSPLDAQQTILAQLKSQTTLSYADQLLLYSLIIVGDPNIRWDAIRYYENVISQVGGRTSNITLEELKYEDVVVENMLWNYGNHSLDYVLLKEIQEIGGIPEETIPDLTQLSPAQQDDLVNSVMATFTLLHTNGATYNELGAAMQTALADVGPNRGLPYRSFYPPNTITPSVNPLMAQIVQRQYEITQEYLNSIPDKMWRGDDGILRRGMSSSVELGIPMSPWTPLIGVALDNADAPNYLVYESNIPKKYVFMVDSQRNFRSQYGEREALILETALNNDMKPTSSQRRDEAGSRYTFQTLEPKE